jgi:hypothetical protein
MLSLKSLDNYLFNCNYSNKEKVNFLQLKFKEITLLEQILSSLITSSTLNQEIFNYFEEKFGVLIENLFYCKKYVKIDVEKYINKFRTQLKANTSKIQYYNNLFDLQNILELLDEDIFEHIHKYPLSTFDNKESVMWIMQNLIKLSNNTFTRFEPILIKFPNLVTNLSPDQLDVLKNKALRTRCLELDDWLSLIDNKVLEDNENLEIYHVNSKILFDHIIKRDIILSSRVLNYIISSCKLLNIEMVARHLELKLKLSNPNILKLLQIRDLTLNQILKRNYSYQVADLLVDRYYDIFNDLLLSSKKCKIQINDVYIRNEGFCDYCNKESIMEIDNNSCCRCCGSLSPTVEKKIRSIFTINKN